MSVATFQPAIAPTANGRAAARVAARVESPARWWDRGGTRMFFAALALNLAAAQVLGFQWRIGNADAITRTANAAFVLFSRDPHAAAVGFVWPVLPSLRSCRSCPSCVLQGTRRRRAI